MSDTADAQSPLFEIPTEEFEGTPNDAASAWQGTEGDTDVGVCPDTLRADILRHLEFIGLTPTDDSKDGIIFSKDSIRAAHAYQKAHYLEREARMLAHKWQELMTHFAEGYEIEPSAIDPELVIAESEKESGDLFRFATTLWSAPVSRGFGRRMRYLVRDRSNGKLIGIFALGDPVFNLRARDRWIGWNADHRRKYLTNVMDAYVVGAVPPYAQLLGGKLVTSLIGSREVSEAFRARYGDTKGIISGERKQAQLVLVTVTSALGRSSIYNRLHLREHPFDVSSPTLVKLERVGETTGYGHFHLPDELFLKLRELIARDKHAYADGYRFGDGPNWRMRVVRVGLQRLGLNPDLIRHGIRREVYAMPLAQNFRDVLKGHAMYVLAELPSVRDIAAAAVGRWILPRAKSRPEYRSITKEEYLVEHRSILAERSLGP